MHSVRTPCSPRGVVVPAVDRFSRLWTAGTYLSADASDASATECGPKRGNLLSVDRVATLESQAAVSALDER